MTNLTDEKIADLLGRITPGPWRVDGRENKKDGSAMASICADGWSFFAEVFVRVVGAKKDCAEGTANAEAIALVPELLAEVARLRGALQTAMGHFDTPIARRRLGIDPNDCEWLSECRDALKPAVVAK